MRQGREDVLPGRDGVRTWSAADREYRRSGLDRASCSSLRWVIHEEDGSCGRVDFFSVDNKGRSTGKHNVQLLMLARLLRMVFDDVVTGSSGGICVDPERGHPQLLSDRLPNQRVEDAQSLELVKPQHLHLGFPLAWSARRSIGAKTLPLAWASVPKWPPNDCVRPRESGADGVTRAVTLLA